MLISRYIQCKKIDINQSYNSTLWYTLCTSSTSSKASKSLLNASKSSPAKVILSFGNNDISSISNSLAFQYKCSNSSYLTLYTVNIDITYSASTYITYGTTYIGYSN